MSEQLEIKKAKIDALVNGFTNLGYRSTNRIGQTELLHFLNKRSSIGHFDQILSDKLFQVLNLDHMSTMFVEDFINGFLQFEEDIRRNSELFNIKLNQEQEIYANLVEQCRRYKAEKLNAEGMCENAKVYGEITDIDIKRKLEGIKEIIIKVIYNEKSEELHFKIGDINGNEMINKSFGFKPTSRKDHFEFIMKGVNDRNQIFDIGSKVFPLTDVNSHEEYIVQIVVPEIDNEEEIAAYIHAKIVLYWNDYKYYEKQKRKAESRLKKLTSAANKAAQFLKIVREIYGDLTRKKPDLIVDFNNEKLMQRKGGKLNVNFNNSREVETRGGGGGNFLVEFNNVKEVQRSSEPLKVEFNNTKEVMVKKKLIKEETLKKSLPVNENINKQVVMKETKILTQVNQPIIQNAAQIKQETLQVSNAENEEENENENENEVENENENEVENENENEVENENGNEVLSPVYNSGTQNMDTGYYQQIQTETNVVQNGAEQYNMGGYYNNAGFETTTTTNANEMITDYSQNQQNSGGYYNNGGFETTTTTTNEMITDYSQNQQSSGGYGMGETVTYGGTETRGTVQTYGTEGLQVINQTAPDQIRTYTGEVQNADDIVKNTQIRTSINRAMFNETTKDTVYTTKTLPVKVLETKINKVIVDNNVNALPVIYGGKRVTYAKGEDTNNYSGQYSQGYSYNYQSSYGNNYGSNAYSTNY